MSQEDYMRAYVGDEKNMWKPMPGFFVPGSPYYNDEGGRWLVTPPQIVSVVQSAVTLVAFARAFALRKSAAISRRLAVASPGAPRGNQNAFKHGRQRHRHAARPPGWERHRLRQRRNPVRWQIA
jgi:hypothetical protein